MICSLPSIVCVCVVVVVTALLLHGTASGSLFLVWILGGVSFHVQLFVCLFVCLCLLHVLSFVCFFLSFTCTIVLFLLISLKGSRV